MHLAPFQALGKLSYSLYLWHWPILIVAAEHAGKTSLSVPENLGWVLVALVASIASYRLVEHPIRHAKLPSRSRLASIGVGVSLVALTLGVIAVQSDLFAPPSAGQTAGSLHQPGSNAPSSTVAGISDPIQTVERLVAASSRIHAVPAKLVPLLAQSSLPSNLGAPDSKTLCFAWYTVSTVPKCIFGDPEGKYTMVLYGDSHAAMWFQALDEIATRAHWRLIILSKIACPAALLSSHAPNARGDWIACDQWHQFAVKRINSIDPDLLLISQEVDQKPNTTEYTTTQWRRGLGQLFAHIQAPKAQEVIIGNIPYGGGPDCLFQHLTSVQACSTKPQPSVLSYNEAERQAARAAGARYINLIPWFCSRTCSSVIGGYNVYVNRKHVAVGYSRFLEGALTEALDVPGLSLTGPGQ